MRTTEGLLLIIAYENGDADSPLIRGLSTSVGEGGLVILEISNYGFCNGLAAYNSKVYLWGKKLR